MKNVYNNKTNIYHKVVIREQCNKMTFQGIRGTYLIFIFFSLPCHRSLCTICNYKTSFSRHIDGDYKLIEPYRFVIHGGIDGFSRTIVYLRASTNNTASTVFGLFQEAVSSFNTPSRVRCDKGLENVDVGRFMIQARGSNRGSILTGSSVHNQRIERLWREVNRVIVSRFTNIFLFLEQMNVFGGTSESHLYCLHLVYLPLINQALTELMHQWYDHPVTTECNYSPRQLWVQGMLQLRHIT